MDSGKVCLIDPLSRLTINDLKEIPNKVINLLDYRVREIGKAYIFEFVQEEEDGVCVGELNELELKSIRIKKVVVAHDNKGKFWVMALHSFRVTNHVVGGKLGVWKVGVDKWTSVRDEEADYEDIAYHNGKFYASKYTGETIAFDPSSLHSIEVGPYNNDHGFNMYLVGLHGDLLAVLLSCSDPEPDSKNGEGEPSFDVYKLDEEKSEWIEVRDLEDQVIFIGDDFSYTISAINFTGLKGKGNRISFRDDYFEKYYYQKVDFPAWDADFYILEVKTTWSLVSIMCSFNNIFWPPPRWLETDKTN